MKHSPSLYTTTPKRDKKSQNSTDRLSDEMRTDDTGTDKTEKEPPTKTITVTLGKLMGHR